MTDPNTPTQSSNNPQDLIDQALGAAPVTTPTPAATETTTLPTPEPLTPPATEPVVEQKPEEVVITNPTTETVPVELTSAQPETVAIPEPPKETKPMGEDMPLAFVGSAPVDASTNTQQPLSDIIVEPIALASVPPVINVNSNQNNSSKPKKKVLKIVGIVAGFFLLFGVVGVVSYQLLTGESLIAAIYEPKFIRDSTGKVIKNPDFDPNKIVKDDNGNYVRQEDLRNKELGIKQEVTKDVSGLSKGACETSGSGGQWCESVDSLGKSYSFCMKNDGSQGTCNNRAVELGYTITYGAGAATSPDATHKYKCKCSTGTFYFDKPGICSSAGVTTNNDTGKATSDFNVAQTNDPTYYDKWGLCGLVTNKTTPTDTQLSDYFSCFSCDSKKCTITSNAGVCASCTTMKYTCAKQTGTACLDNPSKAATTSTSSGKCGTVEQIDVMCGGHYISSTTVLNGACDNSNPEPSTPPTVTTNPILMCSSLSRTPTTTPVIGDKVTFTCVGASTPAGAVSLTYKFRYSLNSGAYVAMTNKTATTSELTIASCGSYKVQCQACGIIPNTRPTVGGANETCDPIWSGAELL